MARLSGLSAVEQQDVKFRESGLRFDSMLRVSYSMGFGARRFGLSGF